MCCEQSEAYSNSRKLKWFSGSINAVSELEKGLFCFDFFFHVEIQQFLKHTSHENLSPLPCRTVYGVAVAFFSATALHPALQMGMSQVRLFHLGLYIKIIPYKCGIKQNLQEYLCFRSSKGRKRRHFLWSESSQCSV